MIKHLEKLLAISESEKIRPEWKGWLANEILHLKFAIALEERDDSARRNAEQAGDLLYVSSHL